MTPDVVAFLDAWRRLTGGDGRAVADALVAAWSESHRRYHTLDHLAAGLRLLPGVADEVERADEVLVAWWFHDAVYAPLRRDNEARSATWAADALARAGAPGAVVDRVRRLVLATADHEAGDADARALVDVDLAILGADADVYDRFEADVRAEHAWVPGPLWRRGRAKVLRRFLARAPLFHTTGLAAREPIARANLRRALARLEGR